MYDMIEYEYQYYGVIIGICRHILCPLTKVINDHNDVSMSISQSNIIGH